MLRPKNFQELLYQRKDVDICGVKYHSNSWTHSDVITGVGYCKDKIHGEFFDAEEGALHRQLEQLIPNAHYGTITSRSRDGNSMTIRNVGPRDPGTHYLIHQGKLQLIGGQRPYFEPAELADVRYITYPARDGESIPGYLTIPPWQTALPIGGIAPWRPFCERNHSLLMSGLSCLPTTDIWCCSTPVPWLSRLRPTLLIK